MKQLNDGRSFHNDPAGSTRIAFLVEETDVGLESPDYLGQTAYVYQSDDVGRLVEVILDMSPGFFSWGFGSVFADLRQQYPETKPYRVESE